MTQSKKKKECYLCCNHMEQNLSNRKIYSLKDVLLSVKNVINNTFNNYYWIKAEIVKLNYYTKSGHCYPDLVEKENGRIKAQIRANIWAGNFITINNKFRSVTGENLKDGIYVLILAKVTFHEQYGLALNIVDIEPSFTLGEMAREKKETIAKLQSEGIFYKNKNLDFPVLPKRIAIISVETSKGYNDFIKIINNNKYNFIIEHTLFPALLQGEGAVSSIKEQILNISKQKERFDIVCIIRGGGGDVGLNAYDNYSLAKSVAECPLPIITGIGHSTNETVVQMVAYANKITPTEAAYFILQRFETFYEKILTAQQILINSSIEKINNEVYKTDNFIKRITSKTSSFLQENNFTLNIYERKISNSATNILLKKKYFLETLLNSIDYKTKNIISNEKNILQNFTASLTKSTSLFIEKNNIYIENINKQLELLKPENILKRGYSITLINNRVVKSIDKINSGDLLESKIYNGVIISKVLKTKNDKK